MTGSDPSSQSSWLSGGPAKTILAFVTAAAMVGLPILAHQYLPLVDLPNHIARLYISTAHSEALETYYAYHLKPVPNLAADIGWMLFGFRSGTAPARFAQMAMAFYGVALIAATMFLGRVVWRSWSPWPAAVALVAYNANFFWGFQNYLLSVPFAIFGLGLWIGTEDWRIWRRLSLFVPFALLLFFMHFFAFAVLAIGAFGRELQRLVEARGHRRAALASGLPLALPFIPPIVWLARSVATGAPSPAGSGLDFGSLAFRFDLLVSLAFGLRQSLPLPLFLTGFLVSACLLFFAYSIFRPTIGRLSLSSPLAGSLIALGLACLVAPRVLNGVDSVQIRLPFVLVAVLFAATRWSGLSRRSAVMLTAIVGTVIAVRGLAFERYSALNTKEVGEFLAVVDNLPPGTRLLPARDNGTRGEIRLWHFGAYALIERQVFVPTLFQGVHALRIRPEWSDFAAASLYAPDVRWLGGDVTEFPGFLKFVRGWQQKFPYVVLLDRVPHLADHLPQLGEIRRKGRFTLYSVEPDVAGARAVASTDSR